MNHENLQFYRTILNEYGIQPDHIERIGKVYKIYSRNQVYALKEMEVQNGTNLFRSFQILYQKGFHRFVPLYPTNKGQSAVVSNGKLYYLSPWLENEKRRIPDHGKRMFRELARMHLLTAQETKMDKEVIEEHYEKTSHLWKRELKLLDDWMDLCEQKWYMSPFEWEYVQYYNEYRKAYEYALRKLEEWRNKIVETKRARTVLIHGRLSVDHFLYDDNGFGYFINFENSRFSSSFHDILPFLSETLATYPNQNEDCVDYIQTYMKHNPLRDTEKLLLKSYLAHPGFIIRILEKYQVPTRANHEQKMTKKIQKSYWKLKNIEYVIMRMEKIEEQEQQQAENQSNQNQQ